VSEAGTERVHASCVALSGAGILFIGPPGSGKSTEALRLIARGAELVADDQVVLRRAGDRLLAAPDPATAGRIEARGVGIFTLTGLDEVALALVADMEQIEARRLPPGREIEILGLRLPLLHACNLPDLAAVLTVWFARGARLEEH